MRYINASGIILPAWTVPGVSGSLTYLPISPGQQAEEIHHITTITTTTTATIIAVRYSGNSPQPSGDCLTSPCRSTTYRRWSPSRPTSDDKTTLNMLTTPSSRACRRTSCRYAVPRRQGLAAREPGGTAGHEEGDGSGAERVQTLLEAPKEAPKMQPRALRRFRVGRRQCE